MPPAARRPIAPRSCAVGAGSRYRYTIVRNCTAARGERTERLNAREPPGGCLPLGIPSVCVYTVLVQPVDLLVLLTVPADHNTGVTKYYPVVCTFRLVL